MAQPSSSSGDWPAARRRLVPHVQPQAAQPKPQRDGCSRPTPSDRTPESARATPSRKRLKVSPSSAPAKAADFKTLSLSPGGTARSAQRFNTLDLARELSLTPEKTPSTAARAACNSRRWAHSDPLTGSNSCACAQPYLGSEPLPLAGVGLLHSENQSKTRSPAAPAGSQSRQVAVMLQAAAVGSNPMQNAPSPASEAAQQECGPDGSVRTVAQTQQADADVLPPRNGFPATEQPRSIAFVEATQVAEATQPVDSDAVEEHLRAEQEPATTAVLSTLPVANPSSQALQPPAPPDPVPLRQPHNGSPAAQHMQLHLDLMLTEEPCTASPKAVQHDCRRSHPGGDPAAKLHASQVPRGRTAASLQHSGSQPAAAQIHAEHEMGSAPQHSTESASQPGRRDARAQQQQACSQPSGHMLGSLQSHSQDDAQPEDARAALAGRVDNFAVCLEQLLQQTQLPELGAVPSLHGSQVRHAIHLLSVQTTVAGLAAKWGMHHLKPGQQSSDKPGQDGALQMLSEAFCPQLVWMCPLLE